MKNNRSTNLVWMDLEMTGLEPETDTIIEIATVITDENLNILAEGPTLAINQTLARLEAMDEWNTTHHGQSGLWDRVLESRESISSSERATLEFIKEWTDPNSSPLCGNSIGQDRRFLYKYMPDLSEYLHYRNIDVSTIKELYRRWYPTLETFPKKGTHLAMDDIKESIAELQYYKSKIFLPQP